MSGAPKTGYRLSSATVQGAPAGRHKGQDMIRQELRWVLLGAVLGLTVALVPSCTKKCGPDTCAGGCCNAKSECVTAASVTACGTNGATCSTCNDGDECTAGVCTTPVVVVDGGEDAGVVDAGPPPCAKDDDCRYLHAGYVCDLTSAKCIPGNGCTVDSECQSADPNDPCYYLGNPQCRCDHNDAPDSGIFNYSGTCRRRLGPCEECTDDTQCGSDPIIFGPPEHVGAGVCKALPGDTTGTKYCLYQLVGQCPCGTVDDGTSHCRPQSNSCSQVGCNTDTQCPSGAVCTVNNPDAGAGSCGGLCVPRCRWDFGTKALVAPGCPPTYTCWVDSHNLDPTSPYYGSGRCKPPCDTNADCQYPADPFGGPNLKCAGEQLTGGGTSARRCRANGDCMDNAECPERPNDQPYLGYCDRGSFACMADCRLGADPVTGMPYKDCRSPYACAADGGAHICRLQTCVEQGGASIACVRGQYCCGEDKNNDGMADPCPAASALGPEGCYDAPRPPFCTECMNSDDCKNVQLPSYLTGAGACANGSKSPSCSPLPMLCVYAGDRGMAQGINVCAPSTWNDNTQDAIGRTRSSRGCPAGYQVTFFRPQFTQGGDDYCTSDADCDQGTDAGRCAPDPTARLQDGGYRKACLCTAGTGTSQCPNVDGGIYSECHTGVAGQPTFCVQSVACVPPAGNVYQPSGSPQYGCGL